MANETNNSQQSINAQIHEMGSPIGHISFVAEEAIKIAKEKRQQAAFEFNEIRLVVTQHSTVEEVVRKYNRAQFEVALKAGQAWAVEKALAMFDAQSSKYAPSSSRSMVAD